MPSDSILTQFKFTPDQKQAATRRSHAMAVTAGAGSGKTRVLVGRYLHLLEQGYPLRSLVAITFTDKAAREMRTRIRTEIQRRLSESPAEVWHTAFTELDAARISTIHSLCAEVLRTHPAEAGLDPNFVVLEEGQSAAWQAQAIEAALAWATTRSDTAPLIGLFTEGGLRSILVTLIEKRLDVATGWSSSLSIETLLTRWLDERLKAKDWREALNALAELRSRKADDKLEIARRAVLDRWREVSAARAATDWNTLFNGLFQLRKATSTQGQKANWDAVDLEAARAAMAAIRDYYDAELLPLIGKEDSLNWLLDQQLAEILPALQQLHDRALQEYDQLKNEQQALDFDDLEGRAALLLTSQPAVRERWQQDVRAVLVDEFQDTNARQRDIVYALTDFVPATSLRASRAEQPPFAAQSKDAKQSHSQQQEIASSQKALLAMTTPSAGELFIVGDAKQSIYKFRGADVSVFRQVQADIEAADGFTVDLDLTFRAHQALVQSLNDLLRPVLGEASDAAHAYEVPFAELRAQRKKPEKQALRAPFVEFHLGVGEKADSGRAAAATALTQRLHTLHREEDFAWSDMALLFRATSGFGVYEDALERAGIPFVTIAGRGFYDRPEIRDVLNALAAIHDPTDDLALAGLLRSPAIGLSDADLYHLRFAQGSEQPRSLWEALTVIASAEREAISAPNQEIASSLSFDSAALRSREACAPRNDVLLRAYALITELHDLANRVSVAEVLKRFLDATHYRTLLSAVPQGHRLRRNVDKLLADAHSSRLISLGEFLEYVQTLEDSGVREGEAPVDTSTGAGGGAVQLMTVHKAKGLEFPVVVIADAAHEVRQHSGKVLLDDQLGLRIDLNDAEGAHPIGYRLARLTEQAKDDAEDKRLLYVAATRAKEKLIISGHVKVSARQTLTLSGWLKRLGEVVGLDTATFDQTITAPCPVELNRPIGCVLYPPVEVEPIAAHTDTISEPANDLQPSALVAPLPVNPQSKIQNPQSHVWRVVPQVKRPIGPAWVVGQLTHEALRRWRFPDRDDFDAFLLPFALEAGLIDHAEIQATINEVRRMLRRFQTHPLYAEIVQADRRHEIPYALPGDSGVIDLLYRSEATWTIVDFKTDEVRSIEEMRATIEREKYAEQVQRYSEALALQIGQRPRGRLVFLRVKNEVQVAEV